MKLPDHLFVSSTDGALYDTRVPHWHMKPPLRPNYNRGHRDINTTHDLRAALRYGPYAWPGGYQMYFITDDGAALSFEAVRQEYRQVAYAIRHQLRDGWRVVGCDINYEERDLFCAHTNERIPCAYGDDDDQPT
jgi:hypothetical protein